VEGFQRFDKNEVLLNIIGQFCWKKMLINFRFPEISLRAYFNGISYSERILKIAKKSLTGAGTKFGSPLSK
jgi:hypothetical protein